MEPVNEVNHRAGNQIGHAPDAFGGGLSHSVNRGAGGPITVINDMHSTQVVLFPLSICVVAECFFGVRSRAGVGAGAGAGVPGEASRGGGKGEHASGEWKRGNLRLEVMLLVVTRALGCSGEVGDRAGERRWDEAAAAEQASRKRHGYQARRGWKSQRGSKRLSRAL